MYILSGSSTIFTHLHEQDWADLWLESREYQQVKEEISILKKESLSRPTQVDPDAERECEWLYLVT